MFSEPEGTSEVNFEKFQKSYDDWVRRILWKMQVFMIDTVVSRYQWYHHLISELGRQPLSQLDDDDQTVSKYHPVNTFYWSLTQQRS